MHLLYTETIHMLKCTLLIGGSKGGAAGACPPMRSNSFILVHVFAEKCPCQRSAPPNGSAPPPHQREILDPPLLLNKTV